MMSDHVNSPEEQVRILRYAAIAGPVRGLDLRKRVPEFCRARGWPVDEDLVTVLCVAVGLSKIGATATMIRRPPAADGLKGKWPVELDRLKAWNIVVMLDLDELLQAR